MNIAICAITYNRIISLHRLLSSLSRAYYNEEVTLIISIDKSETDEIERYAEDFIWKYGPKRIIKHSENLGLRKHILQCGDLLNEYEALIVLEDDLEVAESYYLYAKQCVEKYFSDSTIAGISLYGFAVNYHNWLPFTPIPSGSDVYLMQNAQSWGQVWMRNQWKEFKKWYLENDDEFGSMPHLPLSICSWPKSSWLKYHTRYCIEKNKYFIYPYQSLSTNYSDVGEHSKKQNFIFQTTLLQGVKKQFDIKPVVKYDGFFENESIYNILQLSEKELCIDLYGEKGNRMNRRYYLSTKKINFAIIKTYGILNRPIEMNVINNVKGEGIYLYDTTIIKDNNREDGSHIRDLLLYNIETSRIESMGMTYQISLRYHIKEYIRKQFNLFYTSLCHLLQKK